DRGGHGRGRPRRAGAAGRRGRVLAGGGRGRRGGRSRGRPGAVPRRRARHRRVAGRRRRGGAAEGGHRRTDGRPRAAVRHAAGLVAPDAAPAWRAALLAGAVLLAGEQVGVAQWCLDTTVEHLKTRYQFGRPVGSFQGLKHRLADLWVALTQARAVARYAAGCLASGDPDAPVAAALAQAHCGPVAVRAAEECVQMHGGIGFTWEHPAHLYLKRAKADAIALGTAERHRAALAALVDLPPGA